MKVQKIVLLLTLFVFFISPAYSQVNPMFGNGNADNDNVQEEANNQVSIATDNNENVLVVWNKSFLNSFIKKNAKIQKTIKDKLVHLSSNYKKTGDVSLVFFIFLLAFLYGIFHSLGPGHGKVFVFSYILTEQPKVLRAIFVSYAIAFVHGLSGLIVALIIIFSLKTYTSEVLKIDNASTIIAQISYALIFIIGVLFLLRIIFHRHHYHTVNLEKKKLLPFVLSVGLVPCPGTIITVTFLASAGLFGLGVLSAFFIILGMGITISLIGIISLFSTELIRRLFSVDSKVYGLFYTLISAIGALCLALFGLLFFLGTL